MNIQQLRYILDIATTGSISKSAENLHIAQPNLSGMVKSLENEVGISIFKRTSKGVEVTIEGREFLSYAGSIVHQVDELMNTYSGVKKQKLDIKIASVRSSYMTRTICNFINSLPEDKPFTVKYKETSHFDVINLISSGEADLGWINHQPAHSSYFLNLANYKNLTIETVWKAPFYILMSAKHPLADKAIIEPQMLSDYTELIHGDFENSSFPYSKVKEECGVDVKCSKTIYIYDRGTLNDLLSNCHNTYLWTMSTHPDLLKIHNLVAKKCNVPNFYTIESILYPKNKSLSEEATWIIDQIKNMKYAENKQILPD